MVIESPQEGKLSFTKGNRLGFPNACFRDHPRRSMLGDDKTTENFF